MEKILNRSKNFLFAPQSSVLSAAVVIMFMIVISQVLGVVRQRILLHFFEPSQYAIFLAAFRLPDLVFEVFAFGAFSAAFIPVFSSTLKRDEKEAWDVAGRVINIGLLFFAVFAAIFALLAPHFYDLVAPGFGPEETKQIANIARILFISQGLFVVSYVMTGVLESSRRFLVPALAPIFYNLGIIAGTIVLAPYLGLLAPTVGVVIGALLHLMVQLPLAYKLGFRFSLKIGLTPGVRKIGRLAAPRFVELSVLQVLKTTELYLASIISTASYTYLNLANSLQLVPIGLFGVSLAKAALPTLTNYGDDNEGFKRTFLAAFYQMMFIVIPIATVLVVLRIPIVRLIYGTDIFKWEATVQTGLTLSMFALGIPFQAALALFARAFYAKHDTKTPVVISIMDVLLTIVIELVLVLVFHLPVWSIGLANTLAGILQVSILYVFISKKVAHRLFLPIGPVVKSLIASVAAGLTMFAFIKFFDRWVWLKKLYFLGSLEGTRLDFERFVLDTRYTLNLMILTVVALLGGALVYLGVSLLLKSDELLAFVYLIRHRTLRSPATKEVEQITQTETPVS